MTTLSKLLPELSESQLKALERLINEQVIGEDMPVPRPLNEESRARFYRASGQNFTKHRIRTRLTALIWGEKE